MGQFIASFIKIIISKERLTQHLRIPLYKNAYYLMAAGVVTSILGFVFWISAARLYPPEDVGLASAAISAVMLLSGLAQLGLGFGIIRFAPSADESFVPMINSSLTIAGLTSLAVGAIFLGGVGLWSPALSFLSESPIYISMFLLFTLAFALYGITNQIFISKRATQFAFFKAVIEGGIRILLLWLVVLSFGAISIFFSATLGIVIGVLVTLFLFLPLVHRGYLPIPTLRRDIINEIIRYSLGNYLSLLLWGLPAVMYPLMVVNILGAEPNAYFYIAWAIAGMLFVLPAAISFSVFAEGSHQEELLLTNARKALKFGMLVAIPGIILLCTLADKILLIFGEAYSQEAVTLLIVLALSALPLTVNQIYLAVHRVKKNIKMVVIISATAALLSLGLSYPLMLWLGITGVGIGFILGQSLVAAAVILSWLHQRKRQGLSNEQNMAKPG